MDGLKGFEMKKKLDQDDFKVMHAIHRDAITFFVPHVIEYMEQAEPKSGREATAIASALIELADGLMASAKIPGETRADLFRLQAKASENGTNLYGEEMPPA